jgi:transcriptional regulator with XRE-family HTH domain/mannose-6-phosphate isomerase-like protein (cupin superfamily)
MSVPKGAEAGHKSSVTSSTPAPDAPAVAKKAPRTTNIDAMTSGLIGARLRARRLARGISLRQFARDLDVSASFISQLETGKAQPSVATLFAICTALDIGTDDLFDSYASDSPRNANGNGKSAVGEGTDAANNSWLNASAFGVLPDPTPTMMESNNLRSSIPVVHPDERKVLVLDSGVTWESLTTMRHGKTDFMFVRYDVGGSSTMEGRLIRHVGTEYGYVLSGTLEVTLGFDAYRLNSGDSISFDSSRPHRLANIGDVPVEAIWVNLDGFGTSH